MNLKVLNILFLMVLTRTTFSENCAIKKTDAGAVCVCNSTYCDTTPNINVEPGEYNLISTSKENPGFNLKTGEIQNTSSTNSPIKIEINYSKKYQTIFGFGGAFTDSTGQNILSLPEPAQNLLLESYFGANGNEYSLCRVPIGGTDFSPRRYTLDDTEGDTALEKFALQEEDLKYKIPFIQKALSLKNNSIKLFGTAWTAPAWMKSNNDYAGVGHLEHKYYQLWADYFIRFFEEYSKKGIDFWGMTTQNEPINGFLPKFLFPLNDMGWTIGQMNDFIGTYLGPTLRKSKFKDIKLMVHDDQRVFLPFVQKIISNETTLQYINGVAVHWYSDFIIPPVFLKYAKTSKRDLFLLGTEASNGYLHAFHIGPAVSLGSWDRAEIYLNSIIDDLKYDAVGWVDWNMALDTNGGPVNIENNLDAPIIVNKTGEFYKQPMFYALGHFSKYIIPGSKRIETSSNHWLVKAMAFSRPDGLTAVILYNKKSSPAKIKIEMSDGITNNFQIEARSINTLVFKK